MSDNLAFMNAVAANGGVITKDLRDRYGVEAPEVEEEKEDDGTQDEGNSNPITREMIGEMDKKDVVDLLEAHGIDPDGRRAVADLREELIKVMFVDEPSS